MAVGCTTEPVDHEDKVMYGAKKEDGKACYLGVDKHFITSNESENHKAKDKKYWVQREDDEVEPIIVHFSSDYYSKYAEK